VNENGLSLPAPVKTLIRLLEKLKVPSWAIPNRDMTAEL